MSVWTLQEALQQYRAGNPRTNVPSPGSVDGRWGTRTLTSFSAFMSETGLDRALPPNSTPYTVERGSAEYGYDRINLADVIYWQVMRYSTGRAGASQATRPPAATTTAVNTANQAVPSVGTPDLPPGITAPAPTIIPTPQETLLPTEQVTGDPRRFRMPTWGWWALGLGGVAAVGVLGWGIVDQGWFGLMPKKRGARRRRRFA